MSQTQISNFETDTAEGFIEEIALNGYGLITIAIDRITDETESRPSLIECEEALIAAEFISAARGRQAHDFPEDAIEWCSIFLPAGSIENTEVIALTEKAADAIDRIVADSELRDYWEFRANFNGWFENQVDLQNRILGE